MDRSAALRQLPEAYAEALSLRESGADNEAVAAFLEIPLEAVGPLFRIAEVKLAEILATEQEASGPSQGGGPFGTRLEAVNEGDEQ